ncbi:ribosome biogenesis GTPase Der [Candidatus Poribacteria bacterium]|nr:ribosome biogenesis GTPase Der [Candidatus Poribacteria bacterium]
MDKPIITLVGRPNVGKSTLFNRIIGRNLAVVHNMPGVTRDRIYAEAIWDNKSFVVVDTGGLDLDPQDNLIAMVKTQVETALRESDAILFVVDVKTGITTWDIEVAETLRKSEKPIYLVANKSDNPKRENHAVEFFALGLGGPIPVSAAHGIGVAELLDEVIFNLPEKIAEEKHENRIKIAVVGRPNVGKSSLVNRVLGEDRVIVDSRPGTTRDAVNIAFHRDALAYEIVDTAGMRKRKKIFDDVERSSVGKAIQSIRQSDVTWLVIDATQELGHQDKKIAGYIADQGKACILVINKWDLIEKDSNTFDEYCEEIRWQAPLFEYVPMLSSSALTGLRVEKLLELTQIIFAEYSTRITTHVLNKAFRDIIMQYSHPIVSGKRPNLKYITQVSTAPPTFVVFTSYPNLIRPDYERYLINRLREEFGFQGSPIKMKFLSTRKSDKQVAKTGE